MLNTKFLANAADNDVEALKQPATSIDVFYPQI